MGSWRSQRTIFFLRASLFCSDGKQACIHSNMSCFSRSLVWFQGSGGWVSAFLCLAKLARPPSMQQPDLVQFQADLYRYRMAVQLRCDGLGALIAMDTMIEHFEDMGFANTAHIGPLNQGLSDLCRSSDSTSDRHPEELGAVALVANALQCTKPSPSDRPGGPSDKTLLSPVREEAAEFSCALI